MTIKIAWDANPESTIQYYILERASSLNGTYLEVARINHDKEGVNWNSTDEYFFCEDQFGTLNVDYYRICAVNTALQKSDYSLPVLASDTTPTEVPEGRIPVDHDFPTVGNLKYQTSDTTPIVEADIRIFYKTDYDNNDTDSPLAHTKTNSLGNWEDTIYLESGYTYVIQFQKTQYYGPDVVEISI